MSAIEIVASTGYLAYLEAVKESEECYTHLAQVHSPTHGSHNGYIKFYPDEAGGSKGLLNEACGYLLATALDIPVSPYGMILIVEGKRLVEAHQVLQKLLASEPNCATWVTEQVRGVPVVPQDGRTLDALRKWPSLPNLIAFDDWVLNSDRSLGNLVSETGRRFTAIDHGHIFGGLRWDRDLLTPDLEVPHPFLAELWGRNVPPQLKNQVLEAARLHVSVLARIRADLDELLNKLLDNNEDRTQVLSFLERRASQSYDRLRRSLGMLI